MRLPKFEMRLAVQIARKIRWRNGPSVALRHDAENSEVARFGCVTWGASFRRRRRGLAARSPLTASSPDRHAILRLDVQLVARLHIECLVPRVDVRQRSIHAEIRRAVHVRHDKLPQGAFAILRAP